MTDIQKSTESGPVRSSQHICPQMIMKLLTFILSISLTGCLLAQNITDQTSSPAGETNTGAKTIYRRHIIIAFDQSTPFVDRMRASPEYFRQLEQLFSDSSFFNPTQDEISFWSFGIIHFDFDALNKDNNTAEPKDKLNGFYNSLFKHQASWQAFKPATASKNNIEAFLRQNINRKYPSFGKGVTLSNLVYPLIMDRLATRVRVTYAKEYRLVILSDFLTGSDQGNKQDFEVLKKYVFKDQAVGPNSTVTLVEKEFKSLDEKSFTAEKLKDINQDGLGILVTRIRPRIEQDDNPSSGLNIENSTDLTQQGYRSEIFSLSGNQFRFSHNNLLTIRDANIIVRQHGKILLQKNSVQVAYNPENSTYSIDEQELILPDIASGPDGPLTINFQFPGTYQAKTEYGNAAVNYVFETSQNISPDDIILVSSESYMLWSRIVPLGLLVILILALLYYGKPTGIVLVPGVLSESFEEVNFRGEGKSIYPYQPWTSPDGDVKIPFRGKVLYRNENYFLNWRGTPASIKFTGKKEPDGFRLVLRENRNSPREFIEPFKGEMNLALSHKGEVSFESRLTQSNPLIEITKPEKVKLTLDIALRGRAWGIFPFTIVRDFGYEFRIGPDLGKVWIGLDPGTSGTCIASGRHAETIIPYQVVPSYLAFDTTKKPEPIDEHAPVPNNSEYYLYGTLASSSREDKYVQFRSVKKLLGFRDLKTIRFANNFELNLSGTRLTGMLVKGIFQDMQRAVESSPESYRELLSHNRFDPKRAVVAIPNNFTTGKIQDMIDAFQELPGQFKEVRYVHEAEAVLFYYLSKYPMASASETVLIFDMGGATINATLVDITQKHSGNAGTKYSIDIRGKTGYGIGGDTIDYCLVKVLLDKLPDDWKNKLDPFDAGKSVAERKKLVENWLKMTMQLKIQLISAFREQPNPASLIEKDFLRFRFLEADLYTDLHGDLNDVLDSLSVMLFTRKADRYPLFDEPVFKTLIYDNVLDATLEAISVSDVRAITRIIFAGRSSHFPLIRQTVIQAVKKTSPNAQDIMLAMEKDNMETKYAVALGACWYGLNKNAIELNNRQIFTNIGVQRRVSAQTSDLEFLYLVRSGEMLVGTVEKEISYSDTFNFDQNEVNFFQVTGQDAPGILKKGLKHKFTRLASLPVNGATERLGVHLSENDEITCWVKSVNSDFPVRQSALLTDQLINDANDEHYTWVL